MRDQFCEAMIAQGLNPKTVFLTGDLGFMALERLEKALDDRFINAGVAEQNMMSVAAAMSRTGLKVWAYSIAPFIYARPFEQIRNDIAFHNEPVKIVGNGGGYGYGVMGPTHHAIEDYGTLLALPHMAACVPVFDEDVAAAVEWTANFDGPVYLRLGRGEKPPGYEVPPFSAWRELVEGEGDSIIIAIGPLAGSYIKALEGLDPAKRPSLWAPSILPLSLSPMPEVLLEKLKRVETLIIAEEHVARSGLGAEFALWLLHQGLRPSAFHHLHARAHHYERYGSQTYLRKQSGLSPESVLEILIP